MSQNPSTSHLSPAVLVISCSDARLTPQDTASSWRTRLNFNGNIYEVRCPGGGLAMADPESAFYLSALDSFLLLSSTSDISEVVLTFHEDCFYFSDKYGSSPSGRSDDNRRKWQIIEEAMLNVAGWSDNLHVRPLYLPLVHAHARPDPVAMPEQVRPAYPAPRPPSPEPPRRPAAGARAVPGLPSERATLRAFDRQVEERLLHTNESAEDVIALAEGQAGEMGITPTWRIERRALEFIALLREEGGRNSQEIRQLVRAFVMNYAGNELPRSVMRTLLSEIDREIQPQRLDATSR